MVQIVLAIWTDDPKEAVDLALAAKGKVERIQVDICDGQFADYKTVGPEVFGDLNLRLKRDFHLMVKEPVNWVEKCARVGADRVIGQIEMMTSQPEFVKKVQEVGCQVGLAIDIETPVEQIDNSILFDLNAILVMNYPTGVKGETFDGRVLTKIEKLETLRRKDETPFKIISDGGVNKDNIKSLTLAGADEVIAGRSLHQGDITENINVLLEKVKK